MSIKEILKKPDDNDIQYKQAMWKLLVACGGVIDQPINEFPNGLNFSYYGASASDISKTKTQKAVLDITAANIDWEKTDIPKTSKRSSFAGTFVDYDETVTFLQGLLYLENGTATWWYCTVEDTNFAELVSILVNSSATFADAVEDAQKRIDKSEYDNYFGYTCRL